jgi:hypothetical protein
LWLLPKLCSIEVQIVSSWLGFSHGLARSLATNLRRLRNANGLSQDELAYETKSPFRCAIDCTRHLRAGADLASLKILPVPY